MWDVIWYLGFPMFAVSVFGAPYKKFELDDDSPYRADQFDVIYDQSQNGTDNYKLSIDGLSLIWSSNSLLAAAALLEPALYGEYPGTDIDAILATGGTRFGTTPGFKADKDSDEVKVATIQNSDSQTPTVIVIDENKLTGQKLEDTAGSKRKFRIPGLLQSFLRKRPSTASSSKESPTIS